MYTYLEQLEVNWTSKQDYPLQTENVFVFGQASEACESRITEGKVRRVPLIDQWMV